MAERKVTNKYFPPDWDPSKGTANQFVGQHPLRSRARKLDQGILVVRMALPFSMWCNGCGGLLAKGLRFNAEKEKAGSFLELIPVWSFRIKCRICSNQQIELQTDPESSSYVVVSGARKMAELKGDSENEDDDESFGEDIVDMANDSVDVVARGTGGRRLRELEIAEHRKKRAAQAMDRLASLKKDSDKNWRNADRANSELRGIFRKGRNKRAQNKRESDEIQERMGINVPILPAESADSIEASAVEYGERPDESSSRKRTRIECTTRPLFGMPKSEGKLGLKDQVIRKRLGDLDPFASTSIGNFAVLPKLGIKLKGSKGAKDSDDCTGHSLTRERCRRSPPDPSESPASKG